MNRGRRRVSSSGSRRKNSYRANVESLSYRADIVGRSHNDCNPPDSFQTTYGVSSESCNRQCLGEAVPYTGCQLLLENGTPTQAYIERKRRGSNTLPRSPKQGRIDNGYGKSQFLHYRRSIGKEERMEMH